jgi:hypothetical protein
MSFPTIAIQVADEVSEKLQCLGSEIMRWDQNIYLIDVTHVMAFWQKIARERKLSVTALWREILLDQFAQLEHPSVPKVIFLAPAFRASFATHPWKSLLMLSVMQERKILGLTSFHSPYGTQIFNSVSWQKWWQCVDRLIAIVGKPVPAETMWRRRLKTAMRKLNLDRPLSASMIPHEGIRRRYGKMLASIWQWTFSETGEGEAFPWRPWQVVSLPHIHRNLNDPLSEWAPMIPFLCKDLDSLSARLTGENGQRCTRLVWRLTLEDLETIEVGVSFRHPHDFQKDQGSHTTVIYQLELQFSQASRQRFSQDQRVSGDDDIYPVIAWDLEIAEIISLSPTTFDLFGDMESERQENNLQTLVNQLEVALSRFSLRSDFWPENSFQNHLDPSDAIDHNKPSLVAAARARPLYLFKSPRELSICANGKPQAAGQQLSEIISPKWWRTTTGHSSDGGERCYYTMTTSKGEALWAFRDAHGRWFWHGIFG